jgi:hypothetical protein
MAMDENMKCSNCLKRMLVLLLFITAQSAGATKRNAISGKLFFIAGTPEKHTPLRFPTVLYGVDVNMALKRLRPITTQEQGSEFIRPYYDDKLVLIGNKSQKGFYQLDYIDMNHVLQPKSYEIQLCEGCSYSRSYHLQKEGKLLHQVQALKSKGGNAVDISFYGINYKDGSSVSLTNTDIDFAQAFGASSGNFNGDQIQWLHAIEARQSHQIWDNN